MKKAVFIDRDGVINSDEGHYYIYRVDDFVLNNDVIAGLKMLSDAGFLLVVITNQGGVAKGIYSLDDVAAVHNYLKQQLREAGIELAGIKVCPHHESVAPCTCRKPSPQMILEAASELNIDLQHSYLIGDSKRDIEAGEAAGLKQCFKIQSNASILDACNQIVDNCV
jgi:D-glycero-D-manno-heptose 1,7-bisphosphate phosphatase